LFSRTVRWRDQKFAAVIDLNEVEFVEAFIGGWSFHAFHRREQPLHRYRPGAPLLVPLDRPGNNRFKKIADGPKAAATSLFDVFDTPASENIRIIDDKGLAGIYAGLHDRFLSLPRLEHVQAEANVSPEETILEETRLP
jgi:hypothetical protein